LVALSATACSHSYLFAGEAPPRFVDGEVVIERAGEAPETFRVERVLVQDAKVRGARLPSSDEIVAWREGLPTPGLDLIRVDVSSSGQVWEDWVLPGFGIGAALAFVTLGSLGAIRPGDLDSGGISLPFAALLAFALGVEGALIGGGIGALVESGTTDMRLPGGASLGSEPWPGGGLR